MTLFAVRTSIKSNMASSRKCIIAECRAYTIFDYPGGPRVAAACRSCFIRNTPKALLDPVTVKV